VGGGNGSLLSAILNRHAHLKGTLLEWEPAVVAARAGAGGTLLRSELIVRDFHRHVPSGGDIYILKKIVHNWSEERAAALLRNCRRAMNPDGRVLIIETLVGPANESTWGKMQDFTMLLVFGDAMERATEAYADLPVKADLRLDHVQELSAETAVVVAAPA
jgi:hypothetical protein